MNAIESKLASYQLGRKAGLIDKEFGRKVTQHPNGVSESYIAGYNSVFCNAKALYLLG